MTINGEDDPISYGAGYACSIMPSAEYVSVPGAGHFLHYENPEIISLYFDFFSENYRNNKFYRHKREYLAA
jgi:pimeloyl-ACP methyl ester carboxylesterase